MGKLFAGVDGGGTKTLAIITDESGQELGRAEAGPSNWNAIGLEAAVQNITDALNQALDGASQAAGLAPRDRHLQAACFGLAGAGRAKDAAHLQAALAHLAERVSVTHDAAIALAGALQGQEGAIIIAGTGSIAYGEKADGNTARAGGWGWILDDLGGGYDVGRRSLQAVLQAHDGRGPATSLTQLILDHWGLSHPEELIAKIYRPQIERVEVAALSRLTGEAAEAGDLVALGIWSQAGHELARIGSAVFDRLGLASGNLATIGSLWKAGRLLRDPFEAALAAQKPGVQVTSPAAGPAEGAALLARMRLT